jgi:DHA2 family multidrug resistance protein
LQGFGVVIFFLPIVQISVSEVPVSQLPSATGVFHFIRILVGSGFGTSLAIEFWTHFEIFHHARLSEAITDARNIVYESYNALENWNPVFTPQVVNAVIDREVEQQAFMLSTNDLAWIGGWLFIAMIPMMFLCHRVKGSKTGGAAAASH